MSSLDSLNIVWIVSYPKSGNTWFRIFLSNLMSEESKPVSINAIPISKIASDRALVDEISGINSSDLHDDEVDLLRPKVYRELSRSSKETHYIKVHDAWTRNKNGDPIFPLDITKAVVYIIRNPLDVAPSFARHQSISKEEAISRMENKELSLSGNPNKIGNQCRQKLLNWSSHVASWVDAPDLNVHVIRYEDMLSTPESSFGKALDFLNIPYDISRLRKAITYSEFSRLRDQELQNGFLEKPIEAEHFFHSGQAGIGKNQLPSKSVQQFVKDNLEIMNRFGYVPG